MQREPFPSEMELRVPRYGVVLIDEGATSRDGDSGTVWECISLHRVGGHVEGIRMEPVASSHLLRRPQQSHPPLGDQPR